MPEDEALGILLPLPLPSRMTLGPTITNGPVTEQVQTVLGGGSADLLRGNADAVDDTVLVSGGGVLPTPSRSTAKKKKKKRRVDADEGRRGEVQTVAAAVAAAAGGNGSSAQKKAKQGGASRVEDAMGLVSGA